MEKSTGTIGTQEFNDVWKRVTGKDTGTQGVEGLMAEKTDKAQPEIKTPAAVAAEEIGPVITPVKEPPVPVSPIAVQKPVTLPSEIAAATEKKPAVSNVTKTAPVSVSNNAQNNNEDIEQLLGIMENTAETMRECCFLANNNRGRVRSVCRSIEQSCQCTIKELNLQYYMLTGKSCSPGTAVIPGDNTSATLRRICNNEAETSAQCLAAAENTNIPSLERAYIRAAECANRRGCAAQNLLGDIFCNGRSRL